MLEAAEAWGVPPWEIAPPDNKFLWYSRWSAYSGEINKAQREAGEKARSKGKRR